jgi:tetratricopeptide (TPR) repeat protein
MGFRFYRSVSLGKGVRLNLSKTGVGISAGVPGLRYSVHSSGRTVKTAGIPGTGLYYRKDSYARGSRSATRARRGPAPPHVQIYPKAGLLAPKEDKLFVRGVTAYMQGRHAEALELFRGISARDAADRHVAEELFAAMSLVALDRAGEAVAPLETVVGSHRPLPDELMQRYGVDGVIEVDVTPFVAARLPIGSVGAALLLAEVYQQTGRAQKAIELLESLGSLSPEPVVALSLAELYTQTSAWRDVIRVTDGFRNVDDATCHLQCMRSNALRELGTNDAALEAAREALRSRSRRPEILRLARYQRALAYEAAGRTAIARKDLERIFAEDSTFLDVAERLATPSGSA